MARMIVLKTEKIEVDGIEQDFSYSDTIKSVLSKAGAGGLSMDEIRQSNKIIDRLESDEPAVKDNITLEDRDWEYLQQKIKGFRWAIAHKAIENFGDAIDNAKNVDI